jgi:protein-S-isoprenylcysteine O-methyltransferase Ste14
MFKTLLGTFVLFSALFVSSGRFNYWQGWLFLTINTLMTFVGYLSIQKDTELINERFNPGSGIKMWDSIFIFFSLPTYISILIVAGMDSGRYNWSPPFPNNIYLLGIAVFIIGQTIFHIAKKQNKYFSSVVRIQTDRGHTICDTGLYKIVRHPGYVGSIISSIGLPMFLGSLWCIIPAVIHIIQFLIRTHFEDITLINELNGYQEYSTKTKYRLIIGIW